MSELVGILKSTVSVRARWCDNVQACARASCSSWSNGDQHRQLWWLMPYIVKLDCQGAPKRREMDWQVSTNQSVTVQLLQRNLPNISFLYSSNPKIPIPPDSPTKSPSKPSITPLTMRLCSQLYVSTLSSLHIYQIRSVCINRLRYRRLPHYVKTTKLRPGIR